MVRRGFTAVTLQSLLVVYIKELLIFRVVKWCVVGLRR